MKRRGCPIIPGRSEVADFQTKIGCGGVQVRPGDIIGCDADGIIVVPLETAEEVAIHARAVLLADMRGRRKHHERLGMPYDEPWTLNPSNTTMPNGRNEDVGWRREQG